MSVRASPPLVRNRPVRPRQHGPGGLVDGPRPSAPGLEPAGRASLAARGPRRPDPGRLRTAVVDLAEPELAARQPGGHGRARCAAALLARAQTHRLRAGGPRILAGVSALPCDRVDDAKRVPPRRPVLPAAPLCDLVPR